MMRDSSGDRRQPCFQPLLTVNQWLNSPSCITAHWKSLYRSCMRLIIFSGIPQCLRSFHMVGRWTESNGFSKSMKLMKTEFWCSFISSRIVRSVNIRSKQLLLFRKPACSLQSLLSKGSWIRCRIHLVKTFRTMLKCDASPVATKTEVTFFGELAYALSPIRGNFFLKLDLPYKSLVVLQQCCQHLHSYDHSIC